MLVFHSGRSLLWHLPLKQRHDMRSPHRSLEEHFISERLQRIWNLLYSHITTLHTHEILVLSDFPPPHATNFITAKPRVNHNTALAFDSPQMQWTQPCAQSHKTHNQTERFMLARDFISSTFRIQWKSLQTIMSLQTSYHTGSDIVDLNSTPITPFRVSQNWN